MKGRMMALALCLASFCAGQENSDVDSLLSQMRAAYRGIRTAKLTMECDLFGDGGRQVHVTAQTWYAAPLKLRVEAKGIPGLAKAVYVAITDGHDVFLDGTPGAASIQNYTEEGFLRAVPFFNLEVMCLWDWARQLSRGPSGNMHFSTFRIRRESWRGRPWLVLEETAKQQGVRVEYFVDERTHLIWRTLSKRIRSDKAIQDAWLDKLETNTPINPNLLSIPPTGRSRAASGSAKKV